MDTDQRAALIAEINVGDELRNFKESPVGRYLLGRAKLYREHILELFRQVSPTDADGIRKLQSLSEVPELFENWIDEQISAGEEARMQLSDEYEETSGPGLQ